MRFIRGETLQQAVEQLPPRYPPGTNLGAAIAFQKLIRSFLAVCQTMGFAHSQHVIHRDLKPANIMLGYYGETLVVDWGLAKRLPEPVDTGAETLDGATAAQTTVADQTMLGQIKGSPAYMSPEQAEGRTDQIGPRSDIYGLGATLYTILAGKLPFADMGLHQLLDHVKRGDFPPPSQVRGDVPPALEAICLKAMRLDPADSLWHGLGTGRRSGALAGRRRRLRLAGAVDLAGEALDAQASDAHLDGRRRRAGGRAGDFGRRRATTAIQPGLGRKERPTGRRQ